MRERSQEQKLDMRRRQLEDAKKKLGQNSPAIYDINEELEQINNSLAAISKNGEASPVSNTDEISDQDLPFGQDLNTVTPKQQEKQRATKQVLQNEPQVAPTSNTGPQAQASAKPGEDVGQQSLKPNNDIPGGRARSLFRRNSSTDTKTGTEAEATSSENAAGKVAKQLASKATQAIRQAGAKLIQKIILGGPATWIIAGVGIILVIILFIVGLSYIGTLSSKRPSPYGGTQIIAVDPKKDTGVLENFMKLTGEKDVTNKALDERFIAMKNYLTDAKDDENVTGNTVITGQIDAALTALDALASSKTPENAKGFLTQLSKVYDLLEGNVPVWTNTSEPTRSPIDGDITKFNPDRHGHSFLVQENVASNNVYLRNDDGQARCDAVDIVAKAGENIYPIFGGKVIDVSPDGEDKSDAGSKKVTITSVDGKYTALYAHIMSPMKKTTVDGVAKSEALKKDDTLLITEPIGVSSTNNVQIEVFYAGTNSKTGNVENSCLVINHADMIDHKSNERRHDEWGAYLWDRIAKTFNLR